MERWLEREGEPFLKEVGVKEGQTVLDFGCGVGDYAIPSAKVVGKRGEVYALDNSAEALNQLLKRAKRHGLNNLLLIKTSAEPKLPLLKESVDTVLLYDVLHAYYFPRGGKRQQLLREIYRVSKGGALISVFPKHMEPEHIRTEMEKANFHFERQLAKSLLHNHEREQGRILNFRKR
jgi:ubiquinone/menaquinone biosynthesis C-methylase UbiE